MLQPVHFQCRPSTNTFTSLVEQGFNEGQHKLAHTMKQLV